MTFSSFVWFQSIISLLHIKLELLIVSETPCWNNYYRIKNITRQLFLLLAISISNNELSYLNSNKQITDAWIVFEGNVVRKLLIEWGQPVSLNPTWTERLMDHFLWIMLFLKRDLFMPSIIHRYIGNQRSLHL